MPLVLLARILHARLDDAALVAAVGMFVRPFESLREALGGRLITAADAEALGPKLNSALRGNELVLLKASRGIALERVLNYLT